MTSNEEETSLIKKDPESQLTYSEEQRSSTPIEDGMFIPEDRAREDESIPRSSLLAPSYEEELISVVEIH